MRRMSAHAVLALTLGAAAAAAQQPPVRSGVPEVDSASVARAAWREGLLALRGGDSLAGYRHATHATTAWPSQPAYLVGRARLAARLGDPDGLASTLAALAGMEAGAVLLADAAVTAAGTTDARVAEARRALELRVGPLSRSVTAATIPDSTIFAEGIDADVRTRRLYVGSIRQRTVLEVAPDGTVRDLALHRVPGIGAIMGVRVDPSGEALYATTVGIPQMAGFTPADTVIAALLRIRIADGSVERRWDLPAERDGHAPGDLAIGPSGDVFVSDSRVPVLYRLRPGANALERITHPLFRSLQGVAPTLDGAAVFVADYSHGLLRVDLATGAVIRLGDAPGTTSLGCDGIALHRGTIVAVQNGLAPPRVVRFHLDATRRHITSVEVLDRALPVADEPTIGTVVGDDFIYVANSHWEKYDEEGRRRPGAALAPTVLLRLHLSATPQPPPNQEALDRRRAAVARLFVGAEVKVQARGASQWVTTGTLSAVRGDSLLVAESPAGVRAVPVSGIQALWQRGRGTRTGALVGGIVFGLAGMALGNVGAGICDAADCPDMGANMLKGALLGVVIGAPLGGLVGSSIPAWRRVL